jgi:hypothetical protein
VHDGDQGWATQPGSTGTLEDGVTRREDRICTIFSPVAMHGHDG